MDADFWIVLGVALTAGLSSPLGGFLATRIKASSLWLSLVAGLAAGILLGTLSLEMIPTALEDLDAWLVIVAVIIGIAATYGLDFAVNRGRMAGDKADQKPAVDRYHRRHKPWGTQVTVLAAATASEELIEGLSIGVGLAISLSTAIVVGIAITVDNIAEALSLGALARDEDDDTANRRTLLWTIIVGVSLIASALLGYFFLRDLPEEVLAFLLAVGAGAMLYLSTTQLLPEAEEKQFQQSAGLSIGLGFLIALALSQI
ncbi:ZIP family metal transporter [Devosia rhizoryzae]|uniref:ZIP family metal transporter n=1 Tax=Devosia rhizoryzae TaxID=2774137 RepID=A0ABX7C4H3_9HYPH|nr:ZIP family metal transporter [Devosia rhizoryzae]QQR38139.1 ZIP family metal transporter [Devosia rhizoryzae]